MPREKAMESYVDQLRKIVETMSYTENVADFYGSINQLDKINLDDLQLVAPEVIKKERSNPNSPLHSRETSPTRTVDSIPNGVYTNGYQNGYSHSTTTDTSDDDEYIDTVEVRTTPSCIDASVNNRFSSCRMKFPSCQSNTCRDATESQTTPNTTAEYTKR